MGSQGERRTRRHACWLGRDAALVCPNPLRQRPACGQPPGPAVKPEPASTQLTTRFSGYRFSQEWIWEQMRKMMPSGHSPSPEGFSAPHAGATGSGGAEEPFAPGGHAQCLSHRSAPSSAQYPRSTNSILVAGRAHPLAAPSPVQAPLLTPDLHGQLAHRVVKQLVSLHVAPARRHAGWGGGGGGG